MWFSAHLTVWKKADAQNSDIEVVHYEFQPTLNQTLNSDLVTPQHQHTLLFDVKVKVKGFLFFFS